MRPLSVRAYCRQHAHSAPKHDLAAAARYDIFGYDKLFALVDLKSATQCEPSGFFFDEDMAFA